MFAAACFAAVPAAVNRRVIAGFDNAFSTLLIRTTI